MRRREFIVLVASTAAAPLTARAQQPQQMRRIGMLMTTREDDVEGQARLALLRQGLKELGWTEGRNINVDYRWTGGDAARAKTDAAELVSQKPDLIIAKPPPPPHRTRFFGLPRLSSSI
jgi:putative ABC transport system substrate-binding protein